MMTRDEILESIKWHTTLMEANPGNRSLQEDAREAIDYMQNRLEEGDFRPGDQIGLLVEGEPDFPDTVVVEAGPSILLPNVGSVSLKGVLRSELQDHLTRELGRYLRDPVLRVWPTIRLTVRGRVGQPGFYTFPAALPLGNAIMQAGGPDADANMEKITVLRGEDVVLDSDAVETAIAQGRTFDQLGLRPGDEINVPAKPSVWPYVLRYGVPLVSILILGIRLGGGY